MRSGPAQSRGIANVCMLLCVKGDAKEDGGFRCVILGGRRGGEEDERMCVCCCVWKKWRRTTVAFDV